MMTHGGSIPVLQGLKQEDYHQFKDSLGYTVSSRPCNEWLRKACLWKANCRSRESHSLVGTRPQGRHGKMSGNRVRCRCGIRAQSPQVTSKVLCALVDVGRRLASDTPACSSVGGNYPRAISATAVEALSPLLGSRHLFCLMTFSVSPQWGPALA